MRKKIGVKKIAGEGRDGKTLRIRILPDEETLIKEYATMRNLSVSEYMRRMALKKRADVQYETIIVMELREIIDVIKLLVNGMVEHGFEPPREDAVRAIIGARDAMLRISK